MKHGGYCYAGKDIDEEIWIRPVSNDDGHAIDAYYRVVGKKDPAKVGDVLSMSLGASVAAGYQSENFEHRKVHWKRIGTFDFDDALGLADQPDSLWGEGHSSAHGVRDTLTEAQANAFDFSLCLIEVHDLMIVCEEEKGRPRTRARFTYRNIRYKFAITDPEYFDYEVGEHMIGHALLCCSLTEPFPWSDGSMHASKLVAAIITRERLG
ncbi:hypothetical protein DMC47_42150 [Nostoc sp. 3335mG]|nr:hypothetical protein DMC47_42150 [Nostoc sp. 3335mG]